MKQFIEKVVEKSKAELKLDLFSNWLATFDFK
jgi:hypothetical protein